MSLPGLGLVAPISTSTAPSRITAPVISTHELPPNSEWRFEVAIGTQVELKVLSGTAEILGTELAVNHVYTFNGIKAAVFTWHGCKIEVNGQCEEYTAEETPMVSYVNTHFALEGMRQRAPQTGQDGPRVLVVGPQNAGKTSLVKILTAYSTRSGGQPMVVNTDSREGMLSVPGTLTGAVFGSIIDVEDGWGSSPTSGPSNVPVKLPLCYFYGLPNAEDNGKLFKAVLTRMGLAATSRLADDPHVKRAGIIIDTPGAISHGKEGYDIIAHIVSEFTVNVIIVLGSERLHSDMVRRFENHKTTTNESITVVKLDKSGGCVDRDEKFMQQARQSQIREYFFGNSRRTLSPHTQTVDFNAVTIYKIHEADAMLASFLPGGEEDREDPLFDKVEPSTQMLHCILPVMYASPHDSQETIRDASIMGFVYVAEIDEKKRRLRILAPLSGKVGDRPLIWGSWPEPAMNLLG